MRDSNQGFLTDYQRGVLDAVVQERPGKELPTLPAASGSVLPRPVMEPSTKRSTSVSSKSQHVIAPKQERRPHTVVNGRPKKGGCGGKGTWGNPLDPCDDLEAPEPDDPLYEEYDEYFPVVTAAAPIAEAVQVNKAKILTIVAEYFSSGDLSSAASDLRDVSSNHHYYFVKKLISSSLDRHDREKEMAASLMSSLYADVIPQDQLWKGFEQILESVDDLQLDCPDAVNVVALFVARAVVDDILPPVFLTRVRSSFADSSGSAAVLKLAGGHIQAVDHAERLEQVWGGSTRSTVEGSKKVIAKLLKELASSGDVAEATRCIRDLSLPFFHHEVVKQAIISGMELAGNGSQHIISLLRECSNEALISSSQMAKGANLVLDRIDDLSLDIPTARDQFHSLIQQGTEEGWIVPSVAATIEKSVSDSSPLQSKTISEYKVRSATIVLEYFTSSDISEVSRSLIELAFPDLAHLFIKKLITMAMDRKNREKEMASLLLSSLYPDFLPPDQVLAAFAELLECIEDLTLDIPSAAQELSLFLARAVVDDVLPPLFLTKNSEQGHGSGLQAEVVRNALTLLSARHAAERILRGWGGTGGKTVEDAKEKIAQLLNEFLLGGDIKEACQCIRDLSLPFFHHEVVKRAFVMWLEKRHDGLLKLLKECASENLISASQMGKGVSRIQEEIRDLELDIPDAGQAFNQALVQARADGWVL